MPSPTEKIIWRKERGLLPYLEGEERMERMAADIAGHAAPSELWLVNHPPVFTRGALAKPEDLLHATDIPMIASKRGGQWTYHDPGQRIVYTLLDLKRPHGQVRARDVRSLVDALQNWMIAALKDVGIQGYGRHEFPGVWVDVERKSGLAARPAKIAALGLRIRRWVAFHGISVNINPDLANYAAIRPCGLDDPVTGLFELGVRISRDEFDAVLLKRAPAFFGPIELAD